jgi:tetratricopeptide (TPR) repeat protein
MGLPYNTAVGMLVEQVVAIATDTGNALKALEKKIDALMIGDYSTGIDYLKKALDINRSDEDRTYFIRKAENLFMLSYNRLSSAEMHYEAGTSAGMNAMLNYLTGNYDEAHKWFLNSEKAYLATLASLESPMQNERPKYLLASLAAMAAGTIATGGLTLLFAGVSVASTLKALSIRKFEESDSYKILVKDAQDCAALMQEEAKKVLALKNERT